MNRRMTRQLLAIALAWGAAVRSLAGQAVPPESLLAQLRSPDWLARSDALAALSVVPLASRPPGYADAIIQLLEREATSPDTSAFGEGYGEYMIQVVDAAAALRDPRSLRGMAIWGTQISPHAREFVAQQGSAALPYLEEAWNSRYGNRKDVVMTWGLMLGKYGNKLAEAERLNILRSVFRADSLAIVWAAETTPIPEALPLVEAIAAGSGQRIVRLRATQTAASLRPARDALKPAALAQKLADLLAALCLGAEGVRLGACESLTDILEDARGHLAAGRTPAAKNALSAFAERADAAFRQGALSDGEHRLLADNARYLIARL